MAFYTWLTFSLFLHSFATVAHSKSRCPPSSCGDLRDIRYPFRLRGDPDRCGDPQFELVCEGKDAVLHLYQQRFIVSEIIYRNQTLRLVYADFMTSSSCILPNLSLRLLSKKNLSLQPTLSSEGFIKYRYRGSINMYDYGGYWASFMNCTQKIHSPEYATVPCLSRNTSTVYVIVEYESYQISYLKKSCSFITTVQIGEQMNPSVGVFELLRQGFLVSWSQKISLKETIKSCWELQLIWVHPYGISARSIIMSGFQFLECILDEYTRFGSYRNIRFGLVTIRSLLFYASLALLVLRLVFAPLLVFAFLAYNWWRNRAPIDIVEKFLLNQQQFLSPKRYTYNDIVAMTGHFREKLGQGGFGFVFKGYVLGRYPIAIKMLGSSKFNGEEFINEVSTIGRIHHMNIVQLLGFCSEGSKRALIYEYMPNGSLDKYIFPSNKTSGIGAFSFDKLNDIALGIASGINYLHHGCDMQILHFDIKPHNILLDHNFIPKISDFGLAKLYPKDSSLVSVSAARGTIGYIAPELISRSFGPISYKSDIYSFGMLLMEMAGRRRNVDPRAECSSQIYYPSWIYDQLAKLEEPSEGNLDIRMEIDEIERKLCIAGLWCIQMNSCNRPTMSRVVEMLEGDVNILHMPPKPFFSSSQPSIGIEPCTTMSSMALSIIPENDGTTNLEDGV